MSKRKPVYFIEIRRRTKGGRENESLGQIFGAFSSVNNASTYIRKEGIQIIKDYARGHKQKELFFAILQIQVDRVGWENPICELALDLNGKQTYLFGL